MSGMDAGGGSKDFFTRNENGDSVSPASSIDKLNTAETRAPRQRLVFTDPAAFR